MPRSRKPHPARITATIHPVHTRHVLDALNPSMRRLALEMAGGDHTRIHILRPGAFEVINPATRPEATP